MKFHNTFRQCQSDACTGSGIQRVEMLGLIETVEYLINFGSGDTCPGIFYFNDDMVFLLRYINRNRIFGLGMLHSIRQQVVYHFLHLLLVIPHFNVILLFVELEVDLFTAGVFEEEQIILIQEVNQVVLAYFNLHVSLFLFPEVEQFCNQFPQLETVLVDSQHLIIYIRRKCLHLQQSFHLSHNQR